MPKDYLKRMFEFILQFILNRAVDIYMRKILNLFIQSCELKIQKNM